MVPMPRILITNDDGVHSEGIRILMDSLGPLGDCTIVAPIQALMQSVPSKDQLQHLVWTLKPGQSLEPEKLTCKCSDDAIEIGIRRGD